MRKVYEMPKLVCEELQLGVFGGYGGGGDDGGIDDPRPVKIIERFQMHMD